MDPEQDFSVELDLDEPDDAAAVARKLAALLDVAPETLPPLEVRKRSVDARRGRVRFHLVVGVATPQPAPVLPRETSGEPVVVIGAGPAGMFCAYELARAGVRAIVLDRGKPVQARRRDLKGLTQHGVVDPDSNYCFGEGGAGTYSDGKLYTRSHKRGDVRDVLEILALHGAPASILVDARPHIGSNKLPKVITALRERLASVGSELRFGARVTDLVIRDGRAIGVRLADGGEVIGRAVVSATGHSARDVHVLLERAGVKLEAKAFAMGVRIEHPQPLIDRIQYGRAAGHPKLSAAAYQLAFTPKGERGTFSFCMCPGGWIVPAATEPDGIVVNGMSLSRRDSPFANSGMVVSIEPADFGGSVHGGVELQRRLEQAAARAGGGALRAPATRATDFVARRASTTVPTTSYEPGLLACDIAEVLDTTGLPLAQRLRDALAVFDGKMRGYLTNEAVLVGVESRTSSPVRVPRDASTLESPDLAGLYPCGEGAGYAGGIVSAALDGMRVARAIVHVLAIALLVLAGCHTPPDPQKVIAALDHHDDAELAKLLDDGADANAHDAQGMLALSYAARDGDVRAIQLLVAHHGDVNAWGESPLGFAARNGHVEAIQALLAAGADANGSANDLVWCPLALAADSGHDDLVAILLAAHAKPDGPAPDFHGHPPLTAAVKQRCMACVQRLMAAGATIDLRDELGNTALFYTAFAGDAAIAKLLLDAHANPLIANRAGWTPAYNAYYHDKRDVVDALRAAGVRDFNMHDPSP